MRVPGVCSSQELWTYVRALVLVIHAMHELWEKALLLYDEEYMEQWIAGLSSFPWPCVGWTFEFSLKLIL